MSHTFVYTSDHQWLLKISTINELLLYWDNIFNPTLHKAFENINQTKEFGQGLNHADCLQTLIGLTAKSENISLTEAYENIIYNNRIHQYQALCFERCKKLTEYM